MENMNSRKDLIINKRYNTKIYLITKQRLYINLKLIEN